MTTGNDKPSGDSMDLKFLKKIVHLFEESKLHELEWAEGESHIRLVKGQEAGVVHAAAPHPPMGKPAAASAAGSPGQASHPDDSLHKVASPLVGTFYRSPAPESPSFVEVGDRVKKGQIICIIEAMKVMNEVECDGDGIVVAVVAENAQPVEYGEPLFLIRPE
jgi:acetyl-CoA carboxylase biotin carboxyl carrier protein